MEIFQYSFSTAAFFDECINVLTILCMNRALIFLCSLSSGHNFLLDDHLTVILERVRLVYLLEREGWDAIANWEEVLSLGEQQRLGVVTSFILL